MKEGIAKLLIELTQTQQQEEIVICFIEDLKKLNDPKITNLIDHYKLEVTKGEGFERMYVRVNERLKQIAEEDGKKQQQAAQQAAQQQAQEATAQSKPVQVQQPQPVQPKTSDKPQPPKQTQGSFKPNATPS